MIWHVYRGNTHVATVEADSEREAYLLALGQIGPGVSVRPAPEKAEVKPRSTNRDELQEGER